MRIRFPKKKSPPFETIAKFISPQHIYFHGGFALFVNPLLTPQTFILRTDTQTCFQDKTEPPLIMAIWSIYKSLYFCSVSLIMRKPVFAPCEQQRRRSACASAQSDQRLCCRLDNIIPLVSISKISSLLLASVAVQTGLNLPWSQTSKTGFLVTRLILC